MITLNALPLIAVVFILYNVIVLFGGSAAPEEILNKSIEIPMLHNARWVFSLGDGIILLTMILLFVELLKATWTSRTQLLDHGLSMLLFIVCLIEFLLSPRAASSVFFFVTFASLIDVVAGYTIGIRTARRDLQIGAADH